MEWGSMSISPASATVGAQEGCGGQPHPLGGKESGILTFSSTNC